jgi:hypothetical protein
MLNMIAFYQMEKFWDKNSDSGAFILLLNPFSIL